MKLTRELTPPPNRRDQLDPPPKTYYYAGKAGYSHLPGRHRYHRHPIPQEPTKPETRGSGRQPEHRLWKEHCRRHAGGPPDRIEPNRRAAGRRITVWRHAGTITPRSRRASAAHGWTTRRASRCSPRHARSNFKVTMKPMLGCISVAPPGFEALTGPHPASSAAIWL